MSRVVRVVTLIATLEGPIWWPVSNAEKVVEVDLTREGERYVRRAGLIEVIKAVTEDGDFHWARLSWDSFVRIEHRRPTTTGWNAHVRLVNVRSLPSLAEYIAPDRFAALAEDAR